MENNNTTPVTTPVDGMQQAPGRWVAVDQNSLGFSVPPLPNGQPVQGPDGALYCMGNSEEKVMPIAGNMNNAVPTPSGIVQLPPIVQPIALVPYTSQNQPLLQYDPYSRPVDPQPAPKAPVYIRKPYRGISIAALISALVAIVLLLVLGVAKFYEIENGRSEFNGTGIQLIKAIGDIVGLNTNSEYAQIVLANIAAKNTMAKIVLSAIPFVVLVMVVLFAALIIKYIVKLAQGKSPRGFSVIALINLLLGILTVICLAIVSNTEVADKETNLKGFFLIGDHATIMCGIGLLIAIVLSIVLLILPLCPRKNAYMVEKDPSKETYQIV